MRQEFSVLTAGLRQEVGQMGQILKASIVVDPPGDVLRRSP